ncbi:hypothetical protein [Natronobacterium gregoryi]|uniref:PD(D/E)XK endonuclease domain-containing protein n=2 Tax=Natronobacterium gregoryi TaxID=44930 RepID=L0ABY7_NATGS|nr:hypothetical protein [Natronobacterium gregoryi]AFZ71413.1 hypothetical protein Natgr_0149 [Natronobacterium gregoryi SP2]ELY66939.1 hypothetical protein C490_11903 [Natronobacterium gregoryi SP2]PLK21206.1 hypothetical protein CYV19_05145 [Natronobacterium gregoryi SP2]SFI84359.1 hypothetical protein SAMN05443661_10720 [Natronobacterium gregoryi]
MSRTSELESPKASGDFLEGEIVERIDGLEYVGDRTATWHDAKTTAVLEADRSLPFYGVVLLEPETPVEIKGCQIRTSNGSRSTRGRFYVKRDPHEQLLEAAGMYLFVVYLPRPGLPQVARAVVPATIVDELLAGRWYDVGGSRSENEVAKLAWPHVIATDSVDETRGERA